MHSKLLRVQARHRGLISSHFFFCCRQDTQPVLVRPVLRFILERCGWIGEFCDANKVIELEGAIEGRKGHACPACLPRSEYWSTLERKVATAGSYRSFCPKSRRSGRQDLIRQAKCATD